MSRIRLFTLLTACFLVVPAAWADDFGYVDCASHPESAQLFSKARQTPDVLGTVVCGERFTILVYGFVFSRVQTKDGKIGYIYSSPDHPGPWRRQRFTSRRTRACGCNDCPGNGFFRTTECRRQDGFSSGDHLHAGQARRAGRAVVPNATHACSDAVRYGVRAWASRFASPKCCRSACSGRAHKFVVNFATTIQPGSTGAFVPEPAATRATGTPFGRGGRSSGSRTSGQPRARFHGRFSSRSRCDRLGFACCCFA